MMYFAYGSNLDDEDWGRFCKKNDLSVDGIVPVGPAILPDHELVFNVYSNTRGGGALNIKNRIGAYVCGALFAVDETGWGTLDFKEGVLDRIYERRTVRVILPDGSLTSAVTYQVTQESQQGFVEPTAAYMDAVERGLSRFGHFSFNLNQAAADKEFLDLSLGIFLYGALMAGENRHAVAEALKITQITKGIVNGTLHVTESDCPTLKLTKKNKNYQVMGELILFQDLSAALKEIDDVVRFSGFEFVDHKYERTLCRAMVAGQVPVLAWCYVAGNLSRITREITSGSWRRYKNSA